MLFSQRKNFVDESCQLDLEACVATPRPDVRPVNRTNPIFGIIYGAPLALMGWGLLATAGHFLLMLLVG
jgi:hypothetical protein